MLLLKAVKAACCFCEGERETEQQVYKGCQVVNLTLNNVPRYMKSLC